VPIEIDLDRGSTDEDGLLRDCSTGSRRPGRGPGGGALHQPRRAAFATKAERLAFGERVANLLVRIVRGLPTDIGFLISKGGITSNDTLSKGLALRTARVLGQVRAGCSVVRCPSDHPRFPDLPVVIFPGNVGGDDALAEAAAF
jgi:uncharacterized protein YgbK (DUF1537 family)